ncbi:MAG: glycosyltransferase family 4 protein [Nitrospirota bacterium]
MNNSAKKILLISYHFPPSAAVGGLRSLNFAKTLPFLGWSPYVLTIKEQYLDNIDKGRLEGLNGTKIFRTNLNPTILQGYLRFRSTYRKPSEPKDMEISFASSGNGNIPAKSMLRRFKRYLLSIFFVLPDRERNWVIPATLRALREIKHEKIDYIFTTCPPYSVHLIGLLLKMITGVKWIADFRDPWMTTGSKRTYPTCLLSLKIERWLEKMVIQKSDMVTFNVERLKEEYKKKYNSQPSAKFVYIPNGFDPALFSRYKSLEKYDKFTLTYTGSLYVGRTPEPIFKAVKMLVEDGRIDIQKVRIKLIGSCKNIDGAPTSRLIDYYSLEKVVETLDTVPYSDALEIVKKSHLALLFAPNLQFQIPAKVYDYMGVGTKVLALADEGATADFVNSTGIGRAFRSSDISGIMEFIYQSFCNQESLGFERDASISGFKIKSVTQKLTDCLNRI